MRTSEWVVVAYFLYLLATAAILRARCGAVVRLAALAAATCGVLVLLARFNAAPIASIWRDWLPGVYVTIGYWATGLLYRGPDIRLEARLEACDMRLFALLQPLASRLPSLVRELLEAAYLFCYPLVPAGMGVLYAVGQRSRADSYWTLVLVSAFAAYSVLPWAGTRPPRTLEAGNVARTSGSPDVRGPRETSSDGRTCAVRRAHGALSQSTGAPSGRYVFQRLNLAVLARGSIQVNTFPSGHAASAVSVALFMTTVPGAAWVAFGVFAVAIGAGAIVGRYHYAWDVVAGTAVAAAAFALLP